jgi:hypothetical protein
VPQLELYLEQRALDSKQQLWEMLEPDSEITRLLYIQCTLVHYFIVDIANDL